MSHHQKIAFWSIFIMFAVSATAIMYVGGQFQRFNAIGGAALVGFMLVCGIPIYSFVKGNPEKIEKWFESQ